MDTTTATLADELRTAATRLRDTAKKATPGPWTAEHRSWAGSNAVLSYAMNGHAVAVCGEEFKGADHPASADAAWIALASPDLAEPLAAWLSDTATWWDNTTAYGPNGDTTLYHATPECGHEADGCGCFHRARDVARAINGGAA